MKNQNKIDIALAVSAIVLAGAIVAVDYKNSKWNCHYCGEKFKAPFSEYFFAAHTPTRRRLNCPTCGNKGFFKVQYRE